MSITKAFRQVMGGVSKGHHYEYDIIGGLLHILGVGMLIAGIIMLFKYY